MAELIVRRAEAKDVDRIAELEIECFTTPWTRESVYQDVVENPRALYVVAEVEGLVIGYAGVWSIVDEGHITNVAVDPKFRTLHVGSAIISVLLDRYYITRRNKQLVPTQLGRIICKILVESFPEVINEQFTADVENDLDKIEQNELVWNGMIADFFGPFKKKLDEVMDTQASMKGFLDEETDKVCEKCGKPMMKKLGRFGFFLACSGFPECHNTRSIPLAKCPMKDCDGEIVARKTKGRGKEFYGCTKYPDCNFITHFKPIDQYCPECGWFLVEKYDKKNGSYKSCINPDCDYLHSSEDESVAESVE